MLQMGTELISWVVRQDPNRDSVTESSLMQLPNLLLMHMGKLVNLECFRD